MAKQIKYTEQFRKEAVCMYQKGNASATQVARKLGIHEHTMCRWIQLYKRDKIASSQTASCRSGLQGKPCNVRDLDFTHPSALEYVRAIKKKVDALEQLLLQQKNPEEAEG